MTRDGEVYDTTKYGWLQGRQVWMLAKIYNECDRFRNDSVLDAVKLGMYHLLVRINSLPFSECGVEPNFYFILNRTGRLSINRLLK